MTDTTKIFTKIRILVSLLIAGCATSMAGAAHAATTQGDLYLGPSDLPVVAPVVPVQGEGGKNLSAFFEQLRRLETGQSAGHVHIMQIGDSHTAGDYFTQELRRLLQHRFGDGGLGWLMPARLKNYRSAQVVYHTSPDWKTFNSLFQGTEDYGLGGFVSRAGSPGAVLKFALKPREEQSDAPAVLDLFTLGGRTAGRLSVVADGDPVDRVSTGGSAYGWVHSRVYLRREPAMLELQTVDDRLVQLGGAVLESLRPGIVLDNVGTVGARIDIVLRWDQAALREQLAVRDPSLVILAFGTNDAFDKKFSAEQFEQDLYQVGRLLRRDAPHAAVLLIGPPGWCTLHGPLSGGGAHDPSPLQALPSGGPHSGQRLSPAGTPSSCDRARDRA
jgi:peptidoglycan O-acetylesterase-like protein